MEGNVYRGLICSQHLSVDVDRVFVRIDLGAELSDDLPVDTHFSFLDIDFPLSARTVSSRRKKLLKSDKGHILFEIRVKGPKAPWVQGCFEL